MFWRCACTHRNYNHYETCSLCGARKPAPPPEPPKKTSIKDK